MQSSSPQPDSSAAENDRRWALAGPVLRVAAEAGFFAVLYAAASVVLEHRAPLLGPIEFTLLVGLGALVGTYAQDNPEIGAPALIIAVLGGGAAAWLASADARALLPGHLLAAVETHGIGWIGAFAVLRGSFIHGAAGGAYHLEQMLRWLLPFIAWLWALATVFTLPGLWPSFAAYAMWGSMTVIVAGLAGIGLVRLRAVHAGLQETSVRRLWRWLVIAAAISVVPLSLPFVILAGVPVGVVLEPLAGPVLFVLRLLILPFALLIELLLSLLAPIAGGEAVPPEQAADIIQQQRQAFVEVGPSLAGTLIAIVLAAIVIAVLVVAVYALARWLVSRPDQAEQLEDPVEGTIEHAIVVPAREPARPRGVAGRRRRRAVHDAVTAYVSAIEELAAHPAYARATSETPAEHALRVRREGMPASSDLARLAADYQLARYADRQLSPREDRRALGRLDRLRRLLRGH